VTLEETHHVVKKACGNCIVWRELQFRTLLLHDERFTVLEANYVLVITGHAAKIYWDVKAQIHMS